MAIFDATATDTVGAHTDATLTVSGGSVPGLRTLRRTFFENRIAFGSTTDDSTEGPTLGGADDFNQIMTGPITVGTTMTMMRSCRITGLRLYKSPTATGSIPVSMWDASGTVLASKTLTWTSDSGGWITVLWDTPVNVTNGVDYNFGYYYPNTDTNYAASIWVWNNGQDTTVYPFWMKQYASTGAGVRFGGAWRKQGVGLSFSNASADRVPANYYVDPIAEWEDDTPGYYSGFDFFDQWSNASFFQTEFPLVIFWPNTGDLQAYQDSGINLIATGEGATQQYINAFKRVGNTLKWMPVLHDNDMSGPIAAQDDAALADIIVGYFTTDEPEFNQSPWNSPATTLSWRNNARLIDSTRPCWLNLSRLSLENQGFHWAPAGVSAFDKELQWRNYASQTDIGSLDCYSLAHYESFNTNVAPGQHNRFGIWTYPLSIKRMIELTDGKVPIWGIVESTSEFPNEPTPTKLKRAVWSMLIAGARGIEYFDHRFADADVSQDFGAYLRNPTMLSAITALNTQIQSLKGALFAQELPVIESYTSSGTMAAAQGGYAAGAKIPMHYTARVDGSTAYIFAQVIRSGATTASFVAPSIAGATLTVIGESRTVTVDGSGNFTDTFAADYEYHLYSTSTLPSFTAPSNTVAPAVTGTAETGATLTSTHGTWTGTPTPTYTYQWQRDGSGISGANNSTYVLQVADESHSIRCHVTATNVAGSASANSNAVTPSAPSAPTNTATPTVTTDGTPESGETVTCSTGTWTGSPTGYAYQWQRDGSAISGATSPSYALQVADETHAIRCHVTASNLAGSASANSNSITPTAPDSPYFDAVNALSPIFYWRLADLTDDGPNGFDLTASATPPVDAASLVNDPAQGSKKFTSDANQTLSHAHDSLLNFSTSFSMVFWITIDFVPAPFVAIVKNDHYVFTALNVGGNEKLTFRSHTASGNFWEVTSTTSLLTTGTYMVGATYDGTTQKLYINGVSEGTPVNPTTAPNSTSSHFCIGKDLDTGRNGWFGNVDEVAIFNTALSSTDMSDLYAAGTA